MQISILIYQTLRNNYIIIILFEQTLRDADKNGRDFAGYDMTCDEFKQLCRKTWEKDFKYLYLIDLKKNEGSVFI